jgi:hypothetical protein
MCSYRKYNHDGGRVYVTLLNAGASHFVLCTHLFISDFNSCSLHSLLSFRNILKVIPLHNHYVTYSFYTSIRVSPPPFSILSHTNLHFKYFLLHS